VNGHKREIAEPPGRVEKQRKAVQAKKRGKNKPRELKTPIKPFTTAGDMRGGKGWGGGHSPKKGCNKQWLPGFKR